ncbi:unnamed protein product [Blepharisma stoltei]|uniref:Uncharacterized protein n=1 Tax=Blepharisma stoltei TaxID=1481888 RepID=A0AAU9JEN9_9CILI|nr:unnamed protein product [Blepharisma stoltei]
MMRQSSLNPIILCISAAEREYLIISDKKKQLCKTLIEPIIWSKKIKKVVFLLGVNGNFLKKISILLTTY